jgi:DNA-binding response OmpR family regulator
LLPVSKGRVLIIEADEWLAVLLRKFLVDAGFEVEVASAARQGFDKARELTPDCILCDVSLPDIDGFWVARRVRTEPSAVATTPFLFLTDAEDMESRLQGLHVGADLYLTKPFRNEEVVAQVGALIEMARRLRAQRESIGSEGPASHRGSAFQGDLAQVSLSTVLTLLELERRTGRVKVAGGDGRKGEIEVADGKFASAKVDGTRGTPSELLRELLRWKQGKFAYKPDALAKPEGAAKAELGKPVIKPRQSLTGLLLEASRLEDESKRAPLPLPKPPPPRGRSGAT